MKRVRQRKPLRRRTPLTQATNRPRRQGPEPAATRSRPSGPESQETECRALVSRRSGGICEICGSYPAADKAHRLARSQGGQWDAANILDACRTCHAANHANPDRAYAHHWHLCRGEGPTTTPTWLCRAGTHCWVLLSNDGAATRLNDATR